MENFTVQIIRKDNKIQKLETECNYPEIQLFISLFEKFKSCFNIAVINNDMTDTYYKQIEQLTQQLFEKDKEYQLLYESRINQLKQQLLDKDQTHLENIHHKTKYLQQRLDETHQDIDKRMKDAIHTNTLQHQIDKEQLYSTIHVLEEKIKLHEEHHEMRVKDLEEQVKNYKIIHNVHQEQSSVISKGIIGENYVFNHLLDVYIGDDYMIGKCSSKKEVGDIQFKYKDFSICIESKNYSSSVRTTQIDKFIRDVHNSRYDAGIIYNLNSTFVGKPLFHIEYTSENKPIIFISKLKENPVYIDISIKIILFILRNISKEQESNRDIPSIIQELRDVITINRDSQNNMKKIHEKLLKMIDRLTEWEKE